MSDLLIEGLRLELQPKAREHRARAYSLGIDLVFTSGFRTWEEQVREYRKGRAPASDGWHIIDPHKVVTQALPEHDPHCRAAAYDLVPIVNERAAWDRIDLFMELGKIGKELGLVWGGDWPRLRDMPHFELPGWRQIAMPIGLQAVGVA